MQTDFAGVFSDLKANDLPEAHAKPHLAGLVEPWLKGLNAEREKAQGEFTPLTLEDCRPGGVTGKRERGDIDTVDATMHSDSRMVERVHDRRKTHCHARKVNSYSEVSKYD